MIPILGLFLLNLLMLWRIDQTLFWRQLLFWLLAGAALYLARTLGARAIFSLEKWIYLIVVIFLILPLFLGQTIRGSSRWIGIGSFYLQPSELVKPILIGFLASYLDQKGINKFKDFLLVIVLIIVPVFLVLIQPDLGSAGIIAATLMTLLLVTKPKLGWWLLVGVVGLAFLLIAKDKLIHPYQMDRIKTFLDPYSDPLGKGYNLIQAQLAIGSGGWFGRGFGLGRQTQLAYLPEKHTDFIFASIAEELGLIGVLFLLGFYYWLFSWLLRKVFLSRDNFVFYLRLGIFLQLFLQTTINLAMNLGLFPVVGVPLPFVSYGGSSLISTLFSLGLVI